jgi:hypothetical protein
VILAACDGSSGGDDTTPTGPPRAIAPQGQTASGGIVLESTTLVEVSDVFPGGDRRFLPESPACVVESVIRNTSTRPLYFGVLFRAFNTQDVLIADGEQFPPAVGIGAGARDTYSVPLGNPHNAEFLERCTDVRRLVVARIRVEPP